MGRSCEVIRQVEKYLNCCEKIVFSSDNVAIVPVREYTTFGRDCFSIKKKVGNYVYRKRIGAHSKKGE